MELQLKNSKKKLFVWASDRSNFTGEGNLSRKFICKLEKNYNITFIKSLNFRKDTFLHKYIEPFFGIYQIWKKYLANKKICYVNYLPMWNFVIFLILPPKTILGPITGGSKKNRNLIFDTLIRSMFFPLFYFLTNIIFLIRYDKIIFSTSLLKRKIFKKLLNKCLFNFVYLFFDIKKKVKKENIIVIYYKKHATKNYDFLKEIMENKYLLKRNYKFVCVGEKIKNKKIINKGYLSKNNLNKLLSKARYVFGSQENYFSLFSIEAINHRTRLIFNNIDYKEINLFRSMFLNLKEVKKNKKLNNSKKNFLFLKKINQEFDHYFENL